MKILVVDDDFTNRVLLQELLKEYGNVHIAINGKEAVDEAAKALVAGVPYDLICLDIMMPEMDGQAALMKIREDEAGTGVVASDGTKILMITALDDVHNVAESYSHLCDGYIAKPIDKANLIEELRKQSLID